MQVFISQPMRGLNGKDIDSTRKKIEEWIIKKHGDDVDFVKPIEQKYPRKPLEMLAWSILALSSADLAYFAPGWALYPECTIESECCDAYGIPWVELPIDFDADIVYTPQGWGVEKGCSTIFQCCKDYGIPWAELPRHLSSYKCYGDEEY